MNHSTKKNFLLLLATLLILTLSLVAAAFHNKSFIVKKSMNILHYFSRTDIKGNNNQTLFAPHKQLGFITAPGKYNFIFSNTFLKQKINNQATINKEGYRYNQDGTSDYENNIWMFGCSFNWGWSVDDKETISYLLQEKINNYKIHNFAIPGYGSVHALIQLQELVKTKQTPTLALFMYSPFHNIRNIAAPSRLRQIKVLSYLSCPSASIKNNQLKIKMIPIKTTNNDIEPSAQYAEDVTKKIFTEIHRICKIYNITPVLCLQDGDVANAVVTHCKNLGFLIIDISFDLTSAKMNNLPFDHHPSPYAQQMYRDTLIKELSRNNLISGN